MTFKLFAAGIALAAVSMPAHAAGADTSAAVVALPTEAAVAAAPAAPVAIAVPLRANTVVPLTLNSALTTRSTLTGEKFSLTVARDVLADGQVVIPRGTRAVGLVTYAKKNGSFGKSGKMELAFKYLDFNGQQIPLEGTFVQEGEGNTAGTVGAVFAAGVIGGLVVKGHEVDLASGRDFEATILQDVPFVSTAGRLSLDRAYVAPQIDMRTLTNKEYKAKIKAAKKAAEG